MSHYNYNAATATVIHDFYIQQTRLWQHSGDDGGAGLNPDACWPEVLELAWRLELKSNVSASLAA